jgi:hypothetical protein
MDWAKLSSFAKATADLALRFVGGFAPSLKEPDDETGGCPYDGTGGFLQGPAISETAGPTSMEADDL